MLGQLPVAVSVTLGHDRADDQLQRVVDHDRQQDQPKRLGWRRRSASPSAQAEYSQESRLVSVLLDQLAHLPEVGFSLPLPRHERLLGLCNELIESPERNVTLQAWAERLGTSEKTLMRLFQRETGLSFRGW